MAPIRGLLTAAALAFAVLALATACGEGSKLAAPPTSTGELPATSTAEPPAPTADLSPCPVADEAFCDFAEEIDRVLRQGNAGGIVARSRLSSVSCPPDPQVGPCVGRPAGTALEGHFVGVDRSDGGHYASGEAYLVMLLDVAEVDVAATDQYGDGTWRLAAILDQGPETRVLISTSIGPDPIYDRSVEDERRVFFWSASVGEDGWGLDRFLTSIFVQELLTGTTSLSEPREDWLPWGAN